ncbi:MAG: dihydroneopterin aldolase [Gammaproteobacteria bacterium]|nr:dihydroneopterin aldolase [Gammaproteobacteria bacterium]
MDIVYITELKIDCVIGLWERERRMRQSVFLDLEMATDVARAAATDQLADAIDYKAVSKRIQEFVRGSEFHLVETLAEGVAAILLQEFEVPWCRVRLNKRGALRGAHDVGVEIERGTRPGA